MTKLMAALRSVFLVFVTLYAFKELPLALLMSSDARRGDVMVASTKLDAVASVMWLAIGWIAVEVAVGWTHVWVTGKLRARATARAAPPSPPPA